MKDQKNVTARSEAIQLLDRIERDKAFAGRIGSSSTLSPGELRRRSEFVGGVTRWRSWLDFLIVEMSGRPLKKIDAGIVQILRLGIYELLFMRTPAHAAINEAVELAKSSRSKGSGGFVNAILRRVDRERESLPEPNTGNVVRDLAARYSHPRWMVRRWVERFGVDEATELLKSNNDRPTFGIRINTLKTTVEQFHKDLGELDIEFTPSLWQDDFVRVKNVQALIASGVFKEGRCVVQDEAAGLAVALLDPQRDETILDLCSAPGGKALCEATRMGGMGRVVAIDIHDRKLAKLTEAAMVAGLSNVETMVADARDLESAEGVPMADRVFIDAPCSGTGVLASRADLRWNRRPEHLEELAELQAKILASAATRVREGGVMVYCTCSLEPEENEQQVVRFLEGHADFQLEKADARLPTELVSDEGYLTTLPHRHEMDGFFAARMKRVG